MNEVPRPTFADLVLTAASRTPGGVLTDADSAGLIRRGISLGLTEAQARLAIEALHKRPRHPVTRGIE